MRDERCDCHHDSRLAGGRTGGTAVALDGIITDGDLRRAILENADMINMPARDV